MIIYIYKLAAIFAKYRIETRERDEIWKKLCEVAKRKCINTKKPNQEITILNN